MSETKEQEDSANTRPPAEERAMPEYRSHVNRGKIALDQLKEGDKVRFQKSPTESPLWVVEDIEHNKQTGRNDLYRLKKPDGSLHGELVARNKLTLQT